MVGATQYPERVWNGSASVWQGTQDEVRTITAVHQDAQGATVTLHEPLQYAHTSPDLSRHKPVVAHLTRNIQFSMRGGAPADPQRRAHVMFMHAPKALLAWASFVELGRTDKSRWVDDPGTDPIRVNYPLRTSLSADEVGSWDADTQEGTNPRGRYPIHVHRMGADDARSDPALVRGCVVEGAPGWGIASHDSHAVIEDNVVTRAFGAAYVAEVGNELGAFRRNVAFWGQGDPTRYFKVGTTNHDLAFNGQGYWFQGRNVVAEDNVAVSQASAGFFWFHRSYVENTALPLTTLRFHDTDARMQRTVGADQIRRINLDRVPIRGFRNNVSIACETALEVVKANPNQEHDQRSMFFDVVGWNVASATNIEYTAFYTFINPRFVRDANSRGGAQAESPTNQWAPHGIHFHNNTNDMVLINPQVTGWRPELRLTAPDNSGNTDGWFERTRIDVVGGNLPLQSGRPIVTASVGPNGALSSSYHPDFHFYAPALNTNATVTFAPASDMNFVLPHTSVQQLDWTTAGSFTLRGTKSDTVGSASVSMTWNGYELRRRIEQEGTYSDNGRRVLVLVDRLFDRGTNAWTWIAFKLDVTSLYQAGIHPDRGAVPANLLSVLSNRPPVASPDAYDVTPDQESWIPRDLGVLANDSDPDGDVLQAEISLTTQPQHGTVTLNPNGSFYYLPNPGYLGSDSFTYVLNDGTNEAAPTTVTLHVKESVVVPTPVDPGQPSSEPGETPAGGKSGGGCALASAHATAPRAWWLLPGAALLSLQLLRRRSRQSK
jgi:hypothetical protein